METDSDQAARSRGATPLKDRKGELAGARAAPGEGGTIGRDMKSSQDTGRLLERHPILRSTSVAEIEYAVLNILGARRFEVAGRRPVLKVHANYWNGTATALSFCRQTGAATELNFSESRFFRQHFVSGATIAVRSGGRDHTLSAHASCLVSADQPLVLKSTSAFDNLVFRIDRAFLAGKIAAMTGRPEPRLNPSPELQSCPAGSARLERLIRFLVAELDRGTVPACFLSEIEQALAVAFVSANPQLLESALPDKPLAAGRHPLRRAQDYIEAHWDQPLTLEALSAVTKTSTRSLFYSFRKLRGQTPMQYLKQVRLEHARDMLRTAPGITVTEAAFACGFGNLGHFARDYRRAWGERPSDTRRVRRTKN